MDFREQLRAYYESQEPGEELQRFWHEQQASRSNRLRYLAFAAAILLLISAGFWVRMAGLPDAVDYVAAEVAMNHNKHLAAEVATQDVRQLAGQLDKLDFSLSLPASVNTTAYTLLGGRYCSLHYQLAAQLKLKRVDDGKILTLYVTRPIHAVRSHRLPALKVVDGVQVRLWCEKGLFFGLGESI